MIHNACARSVAERVAVKATLWICHHTRTEVTVSLRPNGPPTNAVGGLLGGLTLESEEHILPAAGGGGRSRAYHPIHLTIYWDQAFAKELQEMSWVRLPVALGLSDGDARREFQWYLYVTPFEAELPARDSQYDDYPHYRWLSADEGPLRIEGVAQNWIELPAPMSSPGLPPGCWVQDPTLGPEEQGPESGGLVPIFPMEPAIKANIEAVGWNGALGGHDPLPRVQPLGVHVQQVGRAWGAYLHFWDPGDAGSGPVRCARATTLEEPTDCIWPEVASADVGPLVLYDLVGRNKGGCDVKVNLRVAVAEGAEALCLDRAEVRLGGQVVGHWRGPGVELASGSQRSIACIVELHRLRAASDGRLKLTLALRGRPRRGVVSGDHIFRTANGPFARLHRSRTDGGRVQTPWLSIDLGTDGTCAAVSFLDGYVPRVVNVLFEDGPIYPSRVYLSPDLTGTWRLTDSPSPDSLYTTLIKMGLRFGEGAHPGCPDHVSATEVARFFLKRFLLEVRERMAWFPLEEANVLVSFPPRLATLPRFVSALRSTFSEVLREVLWTGERPGVLRFREEAFLVAVPSLFHDLEVKPLSPGTSRS